jgi:tetratricopeptide (TPR) repeat protein
VDAVSTAVIGWLASQALTSGHDGLIRVLRGDPQQNALRKIIRASVGEAAAEAVGTDDRHLVEDALLREGPDSYLPEARDVPSLPGLVSRVVGLRLAVLAEQGYHVDPGRFSAALAGRIAAGIQADALHDGTLRPLAEWLRHREAMGQLGEVSRGLRQLLPESVVAAVHTLPADNVAFTGRAFELNRIPEVLAAATASAGAARIVTIDGMAGVGKTAFAVHAAHKIALGFPDGQFFIRLHGHTPQQQPTEPGAALAALLGNLGISARQIPPVTDDRAGLWRDRIAGKRVLLILDDATGSDQVRPLLPGSAGSLVLVTSRRRLTALPEALAITLDTLAPRDAARLLVRLAGKDGLAPSAAGVSRVVRLCGYLPLAISLTAGHLKHHPAWTITDLAEHLDSATSRLAAIQGENKSVAAALELSYQQLTTDQQGLFRRLGLLPGPDIDAYAAAALGDVDLATARALLDDLYVAHLADEPARGRYRMHDLIREHAVALASVDRGTERAAALSRLLDYYAHSAGLADTHLARRSHTRTIATPSPAYVPDLSTAARAVAWMRAERANLHAAATYAARHGDPLHATAIAIFTHGFLRTDGHWDQALELHGTALSAARSADDRLGEAETLNNLGVIQRLTQDYPAARASLALALELYHDLDNRLGEANALNYLGVVQRLTKDYTPAAKSFTQALDIFSDLGDLLGQANSLNYLGALQQATGELPDAAASQQRALSLYRRLGDRLGEANALLDLGVVQQFTDDYTAAAASLDEALRLYQGSGNRLGQANALKYLGSVQKLRGNYPSAIASLNQALALYRNLGSWRGEADTLVYLKSAHELNGDQQAAADTLLLARELRRKRAISPGAGAARVASTTSS